MVGEELGRRQAPREEYRARFDAVIQNQAKSLVVVMALMFAFVLLPLYWRRRRHLVFATHFYSFFLLLLALRFATAPLFRAAHRLGFITQSYDFDFIHTTFYAV